MGVSPSFDDAKMKHLEFIQSVIARLASDSFLMKGWGLTVSAAFFGFSAKDLDVRLAAVGLLPLVAFWGLDAYFLSRERMYRAMYEAVRVGSAEVAPFSMDYRPFKSDWWKLRCNQDKPNWWCTLRAATLVWFYGPILLVGAVLIAVLTHHGA